MNLRYIDWIWRIRGSVPLDPGQSGEDAFRKLDPLFHDPGTSHERTADTLTFEKKGQAAQDKMSIFDNGTLRVEKGASGLELRYDLKSRALLFCFLSPLLFLAFALMTIGLGKLESASPKAAAEKSEKKDKVLPQHWIDKALGSPAPEKPKKDKKKEEEDKKPSPTSAYVFAAIFATLYGVGRVLEDRLIKRLFKRRLQSS